MNDIGTPLSSPDDWDSVFTVDTSIRELGSPYRKGFELFEPQVLLTSSFIAVLVSATVPEHYRLGGWLRQYVNIAPGTNFDAELNSQFIPVNQMSVHTLRGQVDGYSISIAIPRYFTNVSIGLWEFTGVITTTKEQQDADAFNELRATLNEINLKVDAILFDQCP